MDWAFFYTNLHELFCQFMSWTNWVNSGKFMDNCWILCQVMADMEKFYGNLIIINLYSLQNLAFSENLNFDKIFLTYHYSEMIYVCNFPHSWLKYPPNSLIVPIVLCLHSVCMYYFCLVFSFCFYYRAGEKASHVS